jgi:hypothetical protein
MICPRPENRDAADKSALLCSSLFLTVSVLTIPRRHNSPPLRVIKADGKQQFTVVIVYSSQLKDQILGKNNKKS